ncbi:MAG: CDP-alcohol phosphatidyltransferase family protein [Clostridiales bacterium]|nr:CDP-alcohol phosphatidyltransferase family protein [Clostridiales bacterium]
MVWNVMSKFKENVKDLFENWNTIPNWMCFLRIALIPVFTVLFVKEMYIPAFITMIVAALTDVFDGKIARKFNMISNLGKILDPIADKLSQIAIVIILLVKFWDGPLKYILFLFILKELLMVCGGAILLSKGMRPVAAEVWGKLATVVFYVLMITIIAIGPNGALLSIDFFKSFELSNTVITVMVTISAILAFVSLFGYAPVFIRQIKENKNNNDK